MAGLRLFLCHMFHRVAADISGKWKKILSILFLYRYELMVENSRSCSS